MRKKKLHIVGELHLLQGGKYAKIIFQYNIQYENDALKMYLSHRIVCRQVSEKENKNYRFGFYF